MLVQFCPFEWQEQDFLQYFLQLQDTSSTRKLDVNALAVFAGI